MKNMTKVMMVSVLAVGTLAAGCQTTSTPSAPVTQPITSDALQAYHWQLVDAKNTKGETITPLFFNPAEPLTLDFVTANGSNIVTLMNTCNNMSAEYKVANGEVTLGPVRSTRMACPAPQASFDSAALATVNGKYSMSKNANNVPVLTISNANQIANFKAVAK